MKKILILTTLCGILFLTGCEMTPQDRMAWQKFWQGFNQQQQMYQQQRMYDAQYNYYTRPYKVGDVLYIPPTP